MKWIIILSIVSVPVWSELVGKWTCDEGAGESIAAVNGPSGAVKGAQWTAGKKGGALLFNGEAHAAVTLPKALGTITMAAWVKPSAVPAKLPMAAVGRPGYHQSLEYWPSKQFAFSVWDKDNKQYIIYSEAYEPNEWHHLAGVYDEAKRSIALYVDGSLVGTKALPGEARPYPKELYIGCGNAASKNFGYWFSGVVDEVEVHDTALSADAVRLLPGTEGASAAVGDLTAGLVGHWKFDERSGGMAKDSSGLGQDAPITSTAERVQGKSEGAVYFTGMNTLAHTKLKTKLESYTFAAWAKPANADKAMMAVCGRAGHHNDIGYMQQKRFYFETFNTDKQGFTVTSANTYEPNAWHHIAGVYDKSRSLLTLYVDGEKAGEKAFTGEHFRYAEDFHIGCANPASPSFGFWFTGAVDDVRVYKRALSADEVRSVRELLAASSGPATAAHYGLVGRTDQPSWFEPLRETVPPVSDALKAKIDAMQPFSSALGKTASGLPALTVNGANTPLFGGDIWYGHGMSKVFLGPYFEAGADVINVQINIALNTAKVLPAGTNFMPPYWIGKGEYDASGLEAVLWRPLRSSPSAKIVLWLIIDTYPEWPSEYPDELVQNENGEYAYGDSHFSGYSKDIKVPSSGKATRSVWSFFSASFRDGVSDMLSNFIRDVDRTAPGKAVVGYIIGGGVDFQMYHWNPPNFILTKPGMWGDYSPAAKKAWKAWLKARYGSKAALAAAWNTSPDAVDFDPPRHNELMVQGFFHDPLKERRAMDWKRFLTDGRQRLISHFAQVIKSASSRPTVVGICSGMSGGRRDTTTTEEFMRDPNIDIFFHQPTYGQRIPPNYGGINALLASHAVNGKLFLLDLDHPTWLQKPAGHSEIGSGIVHDSSVQGWAKDIDTLRAMWRREFAHLWTVNAGAFWDHVFGAPSAYADPTIIAEMKFLVDATKTARMPDPKNPIAETAVIFDEKAVDYLKQGINLHGEWHTLQNNELLASGVPYSSYYAEDLRDGKVPRAKLYIFQNIMNIDARIAEAIERLKKDGAVLVFLHDTGYEQSYTSMDTVHRTVGMTLARLADAPSPSFSVNDRHPLIRWEDESAAADDSVTWPSECTVFGTYEKSALPAQSDLTAVPASLSLGGISANAKRVSTRGTFIDLQSQFGGALKAERAAMVYFEIESTKDQEVRFGAGADWWMQWWVNGKPVYDTLERGNERTEYSIRAFSFTVQLKKGKNIAAVRVLSGSAGFVLAAGGPNELRSSAAFSPYRERIRKEEFTLAVVDPKATVLSAYADDPHAGFALRDNGTYTSVFVGTRVLSRHMIAALAQQAKAWRLTDPGTVSEALEDMIMLHPLAAGPVTVRLKKAAALVEMKPGTRKSASALVHTLDLPVGGTYLFMLR